MNFKDIQKMVQEQLEQHATTILTAGGVIGTVATGVLAARAGFKAAELIMEEPPHEYVVETDEVIDPTFKEKALKVWPLFVPPVAVGTATVASVIGANYMSAKEVAALAAAYGYSQKNLEEYKAKIAEKLTGPKNQQIRDEIAQDRVSENPPSKEVIILADGDVLCYDMLTGRYFRSSVERIHKAIAKVNSQLISEQYVSLSEFYDEIGVPATNTRAPTTPSFFTSSTIAPISVVI